MKTVLTASIITMAAFAAGCASGPTPVDTGITRAETTIENASTSGAPEYASSDLDMAREKLTAAKLSAEKGDDERAARLAQEAELDAQVAMARAEQLEAENALREVQQGIETLRRELQSDVYNQGGVQ